MEFYMVEKFKGLLKDGRWPVSPQGILIPFDDSDSFDSAAEEDDEEYLNDINCSHPYPLHHSNSHDQGYSQDHFKKIIMKKMQEREKYERESVRNADKLLAEEEQERLRVKRQKEMKQRNKERKKAEKETNQNGTSAGNEVHHKNEGVPHNNGGLNNKQDESSCHDDDSSNEDENENDGFLDVNSAFVTKALKYKLKNSLTINGRVKATSTTSPGKGQKSSPTRQTCGTRIVQIPDKNIALGERLAVAGYQFACKESYEQAIELFTRALRNVPNDHRYWGNRSFCYFQTGLYQKALEDADCAIQLAPNNPKGHYRRAEALAALKDLVSAELSFGKALELDPDSEDASDELMNIRLLRMIEMGFERKQASSALKRYISLEAAVEALMNNENFDVVSEDIGDIVYQSSDDIDWDSIVDHENSIDNHPSNSPDQTFANSQNLLLENTSCNLSVENNFDSTTNKLTKKQASMDPSNPNRCVSIWVGNINSCVSEKMLTDEFSRFGEISSIRLLPSSHCAFINYIDSKAPGPAMAAMQGKELAGETLTIRYPNKTKEEQHFHQQILCHQKRWQSTQSENEPDSAGASGSTGATVPSNLPATKTTLVPTTKGTRVKLRGPVNGDECYYWRTTGCAFPDNCRNKHIKENQGVDRKPWHK